MSRLMGVGGAGAHIHAPCLRVRIPEARGERRQEVCAIQRVSRGGPLDKQYHT